MGVLFALVAGLNYLKFTADDSANRDSLENAAAMEGPSVALVAEDSTQVLTVSVDDAGIRAKGTVADAAAIQSMAGPIVDLYGGTADFEVSGGDPPAWLNSHKEVILQLGFFSEANFEVAARETTLEGKVASGQELRTLERLLTAERGFPPLVSDVKVSNEQVPRLNVTVNQNQVTVSGDVPTEVIKQNLLVPIRAEYGEGAVIDVVSVDSSLAIQLNLLRFASDVAAMSAFSSFSISFSQGNSFAVITGGVEFEPGRSELTSESLTAVSTLPEFLQRTDLQVRVIGHTEDVSEGSVDTVLSIDRAKTVADRLLLSEVSSAQIIVIGRGDRAAEDAQIDGEGVTERSVDIEIGTALS